MSADTHAIMIPERVMRQIRTDTLNALLRSQLCPSRSEVRELRCVDYRQETDTQYGAQLWYFEGSGVDTESRRRPMFGALEYSLQFGLYELVDCGVFETAAERERFWSVYRRGEVRESLWHPAHRWLALGMLLFAALSALKVYLLLNTQ